MGLFLTLIWFTLHGIESHVKKGPLYVLVLTLLILVGWIVIRYLGSQSDAFKFAGDLIKASPVIQQRVGTVREVRIPLFGSYRARYSTLKTSINMTVEAMGTRGDVDLEVEVTKRDGVLRLRRAEINGKDASLH
jgi:hypothetical protein